MKKTKFLSLLVVSALTAVMFSSGNLQAAADKKAKKPAPAVTISKEQAKYEKKVKTNNDTITTIAGVINYVCPKLVHSSTKICNAKDPVGTAVAIQKQLIQKGSIDDLDDLDDAALKKAMKVRKILHKDAALQFYDAVEQFKMHFPERAKAKKLALEKKWKEAAMHEEMAWQFLVKTASRGIFAKKMVDGK